MAAVPFGLGLPIVQQVPPWAQAWETAAGGAELIRIAQAADRLGFAHVSCSDHVLVPQSRAKATGRLWYDAAVTLAFLAGVTERIRLLSHVTVLPYRHPLITAKAFATLDHLSHGRVILGVGTGHLEPEFKVLGVPYAERGKITDEYLRALIAAWEQEVPQFRGRTIAFADICVEPRPAQRPRPPIWVGGNTPAAVRRAARHADGWIPWRIEPPDFGAAVVRARAITDEVGRRRPFECVAPLHIAWNDGLDDACSRIETWRQVGATSFHVGLATRSLDELLGRMEWFAHEVMSRWAR